MFTPNDLTGIDEDVARRIIVAARSIAPCIDSFADNSEEKKNAIAILKHVIAEAPRAGARRVRAERIGPGSADYWHADTWLPEDRSDLRSLCASASASAPGMPLGSFPVDRALGRMWPETYA